MSADWRRIALSAVQVWRVPAQQASGRYLGTPAARTEPRATRRPVGSRHLGLALLTAIPFLIVAASLPSDAPDVAARLAPRIAVAVILTVAIAGLALRMVRRRALDDVRALTRVVRRIETGDFDGTLPDFVEADLDRLGRDCAAIARRMYQAEEQLIHVSDRSRRELLRHEAALENVESENARLRAEATVLHGFGGILNRSLGPPQICAELIANIPREVQYIRSTVFLLDATGEHLVPQALRDPEHPQTLAGNFLKDTPAGRDLSTRTAAGWAAQTGKVVRVGDTHLDPRCVELREAARSVLAVPLRGRRSILGVVQLEHGRPNVYDRSDEQILASLANQAAIAIENVRLFEEAAKVEALRELDRLKSELLSTVSHELRTPLASIKGYAGTLLREDVQWDDETRREFLQIIDEESDRLSELIEDLLQMSQIEAGILRVDPRPIRLPRLAQRVVKKARSAAGVHQFALAFDPEFPEICADPRRIEQVLRNLVENAVKYSPDGGTITVRGDVVGEHVTISVSDEGIGIAPDDLARVFDRFYRADGAAVRRAGGTGLGLSICQGIVQVHGGHIMAESTLGSGSTFSFSLPIAGPSGAAGHPRLESQEEP